MVKGHRGFNCHWKYLYSSTGITTISVCMCQCVCVSLWVCLSVVSVSVYIEKVMPKQHTSPVRICRNNQRVGKTTIHTWRGALCVCVCGYVCVCSSVYVCLSVNYSFVLNVSSVVLHFSIEMGMGTYTYI